MPDRGRVPTPDEVESWTAGTKKQEGLFRRIFARRSIEMAAGVGEAATKAPRASLGSKEIQAVTTTIPAHEAEPRSPGPRTIKFAPGVLEHEGPVVAEATAMRKATPTPAASEPVPAPPLRPLSGLTVVLPKRAASADSAAGADAGTSRAIFEAVGFSLFATGEERRESGPTPTEEDVDGTAVLYRVVGPGDVELGLGDIAWDNGERSLMIVDRLDSPVRFDGLVRRLRMTVQQSDQGLCVELSMARLVKNGRPSLMRADLTAFSDEINVDVSRSLLSAGALLVGTKEELLGVHHQRRHYWCAIFDAEQEHVPAVAFLLMRIIPVDLGLEA